MFGADGGPLSTAQTVSSCEFLGGVFGVGKLQSLCVFGDGKDGIPMPDVKLNPTSV